jgi:1-acyl-sn-glycerol-3-phosphate acyltransferase
VARALAYLALTLSLMPVQAAAVALGASLARRLPRVYHGLCTRLLGIEVVVRGAPTAATPVLFVGNHAGYLDITVLGSQIEGSFVAKSEVAAWPLFGWLAKLQRTVFIERRRRHAAEQRDEIGRRLEAGDRLILFPEGTSGDGIRVLPFKSALFAVAERRVHGRPLAVQPFSLAYTRLDGLPLGREWRPLVAWYGETAMGAHMARLLSLGRIRAEVWFHEPVTIDSFADRKALADHCHRAVADGLAWANAGADAPPRAAADLPAAPSPA